MLLRNNQDWECAECVHLQRLGTLSCDKTHHGTWSNLASEPTATCDQLGIAAGGGGKHNCFTHPCTNAASASSIRTWADKLRHVLPKSCKPSDGWIQCANQIALRYVQGNGVYVNHGPGALKLLDVWRLG